MSTECELQIIFKRPEEITMVEEGLPFSNDYYDNVPVNYPLQLIYFQCSTMGQTRELCEALGIQLSDFSTHSVVIEHIDALKLEIFANDNQLGAEFIEFANLVANHADKIISLLFIPDF